MKLFLDCNISQDFWRLVYSCDRVPGPAPEMPSSLEAACSAKDVLRMAPSWITEDFLSRGCGCIDVLVFDQSDKRRSRLHECHTWCGGLPEGSFYELKHDVCVASPGFTFLRMAGRLPLSQLIAYGDELCGLYAFDSSCDRGMRKRKNPLTSVKELSEYIDGARGARGYNRARRALQFVVDRSASPMETRDEMQLCLPYRYGGYGLCRPVMNKHIKLKGEAIQVAGRENCYGDLYWSNANLIIEHQGGFDHAPEDSFEEDRGRIVALEMMGYNVIEITKKQVNSLSEFEAIAVFVAKKTGKRIRKSALGTLPERKLLRSQLRTWNASFGHARG